MGNIPKAAKKVRKELGLRDPDPGTDITADDHPLRTVAPATGRRTGQLLQRRAIEADLLDKRRKEEDPQQFDQKEVARRQNETAAGQDPLQRLRWSSDQRAHLEVCLRKFHLQHRPRKSRTQRTTMKKVKRRKRLREMRR